jgi:hypothetical protein
VAKAKKAFTNNADQIQSVEKNAVIAASELQASLLIAQHAVGPEEVLSNTGSGSKATLFRACGLSKSPGGTRHENPPHICIQNPGIFEEGGGLPLELGTGVRGLDKPIYSGF